MHDRDTPRLAPIIIATLSVALAAGVLGALAMGLADEIALPVGLCTAVLSGGLAWIAATRSKTRAKAIAACLLGGVAAGVLNTPLSFLLVSTLESSSPVFGSLVGDAIAATVIGAVYAAPLGLIFGALFIVPVAVAQRMSRRRSMEALDRTLLAAGVWLFVVGVLCGGAAALISADFNRHDQASAAVAHAVVAMLVLGGGATLVAAARMWLRRRWFRAVSEGRNPRWTLRRSDPLLPWDAALPALFAGAAFHDGVLCRRETGRALGAYRTGERLVPCAVVDLPPEEPL